MKQKKFTSWGVSFASLALVAGMMSYMGITNKDKTSQTNTVDQTQTTQASQNSSITYEIPNQTTNTQSSTNQTSTDSSFSGHHGNFDTTTGGT
jgi:negative regulator of sigma E activity